MEGKASAPPLIYQSDQVEIDLARCELRVRGVLVPIGGRAFEIIENLVREAGELVTTDQLMERVWPGAIVEENTLQVHISAVRKALGPDRGMLKNVKGRGYRLLGSWHISEGAAPVGEAGAPPPPSRAASNNLPASGTDLIGRDGALQELQDLLSAYRLITLTGPGGIGKSRLALEAARQMAAQGSDDAWLVELASLSDPSLFASVVASTLRLGLGFADLSAEAVARAIGRRKILLLLDNCEHVIDAAAIFAETIIRLCPQVTVLATSREVLRIDGEHVYRVPPLDVPQQQDLPGEILNYSAAQLCVARTSAADSTFRPDETNLPAIAVICQRLDGIPLAIEFAAARAAMIGVSQVASELDNRLSLLMAGRRTALARHQTLRAALDWSYDYLTASEQRLLRHVSVFPAGFTLEAATATLRDPEHPTPVVDDIASLVGKSLLTLDGSAAGGRWRLLETIRAYAFEKLRESGEADRVSRRQAAFFRDLLTPAGAVSSLEPTPEAMARYAREIDNIRATLDWCFSPAGDISIGTAITAAFLPVWLRFSLGTEFRRRAENALAYLGDDATHAPRRMVLCMGLGITLIQIGARRSEALSAATEGLRIAEALGDPLFRIYALWALWVTHTYRGHYREAEPVAEKFYGLAAASGDPARGYVADRFMGVSMHSRGHQPEARAHLDRVADQYRRSLDRPQMAWLGHNLAEFAQSTLARVLCLQGFLDQARILAQRCIDRMQLAGEKYGLCYVLAEAACPIAFTINDMGAATRDVAHLLSASEALDLTYWKSLARCLEGVFLVKRGSHDAGVAALQAALAVCDEAGGMSRYPVFLGAMAVGLAGLGRMDDASITIEQALARAERDGEEWCIPDLLCKKGELILQRAGAASGHTDSAERCFRGAIDLAQQQGALLWELHGARHLALLRLEQQRPDDARQILAPVYGRFTEGFDAPDLREAKLLLDSLAPATRDPG